MRNPDQNGRSFESARPFAIAAEANSRTPKWKLRPERSSGAKSPAPSKPRCVFVEGERSAAPPTSQGTRSATAFSTWPEESRLARPFASAGNAVSPASQSVGKRSALHALDLVGELREGCAVLLEPRLPRRSRLAATGADALREVLDDAVGDEELGVLGPAVEALRRLHALGPERLAVRLRRVLDGRAVADVAVHDDERRPLVLRLEVLERALGRLEVVRVGDRRHVPAVRREARRDVLGESEVRVALDRDAVRVVDPAEIREALVRRERRRLGRDAFHHAAVAGLGVHVEVEEREPVAVVARRRATGSRPPSPPMSRLPVRAGRTSSRRRSSSGTRDGPGTSTRAAGSA